MASPHPYPVEGVAKDPYLHHRHQHDEENRKQNQERKCDREIVHGPTLKKPTPSYLWGENAIIAEHSLL